MSTARRLPVQTRSSFEFPMGVELTEGENYRQREGYEVMYLKDDEFPRYQFTLAVSAARVPGLFRQFGELLSERVRVIIELPGPPHEEKDVCEVYMSDDIKREDFLRAFEAHDFLFCHDGMVGFGGLCEPDHTELFLDDHKLLYFYCTDLDGPESIMAKHNLPCFRNLRHFSELSHIHNSLTSRGLGEDYINVFEELKEPWNFQWQESKDYD